MGALSFSLKLFCPPWRHHMYHLLPLFDIMATTFCKFSVCHFSLKARNTKMWSIAILFNYDLDFVILETICHNTASRLVMNQSKRGTYMYGMSKNDFDIWWNFWTLFAVAYLIGKWIFIFCIEMCKTVQCHCTLAKGVIMGISKKRVGSLCAY